MRTSRPKTPVINSNDDVFTVGGLKVLRESATDVASVIGALVEPSASPYSVGTPE